MSDATIDAAIRVDASQPTVAPSGATAVPRAGEPADLATTGLDAAQRFMAELDSGAPARPEPLPARLRPLAEAIVGEQPVRVAADRITRQALRSVGKVAATTGDTIHVDRPIDVVGDDVIAHELTHVAHPSLEPRFFADDRPSPEEHRAEQIARLMRRSPILPRTTAAADPAATGAHGATSTASVRRSVSPAIGPAHARVSAAGSAGSSAAIMRSAVSAAPGVTSAADLAARISADSSPAVVRRWKRAGGPRSTAMGSHRARAAALAAPPAPSTADSPQVASSPAVQPVQDVSPVEAVTAPAAPTSTAALAQFDTILELLEERIMGELERRGGRFRGGF